MNTKFDELAKGLAQSVTRRQALKRFGIALGGMALACFGLASRGASAQNLCNCLSNSDCPGSYQCLNGYCLPKSCTTACCCYCKGKKALTALPSCNPDYSLCVSICGAGSLNC